MTGYQEILTDPSYCRQIVTLTCPHIGNTGVNSEDEGSCARSCRGPGRAAMSRRSCRTGVPAER
jgi:carbamoylphosphate synthase small subunit